MPEEMEQAAATQEQVMEDIALHYRQFIDRLEQQGTVFRERLETYEQQHRQRMLPVAVPQETVESIIREVSYVDTALDTLDLATSLLLMWVDEVMLR